LKACYSSVPRSTFFITELLKYAQLSFVQSI
jgi:hypothetical protein